MKMSEKRSEVCVLLEQDNVQVTLFPIENSQSASSACIILNEGPVFHTVYLYNFKALY